MYMPIKYFNNDFNIFDNNTKVWIKNQNCK